MSQVQRFLESHSDWPAVESIYHKLQVHGYKAFLAGGCIRDALLGVAANDLDLATDATPDQIEALFDRTVNVGKVFGVMRVLIGAADIEVATFRTDGSYKDGRRPEGVLFSSPREDAQRRDFTVNALFYDLSSHQVLDFVQGQDDLRKGVLRTVGDPVKRFSEDHLRLLRAARFVSQLNFRLEESSFVALKSLAALVTTVSGERIRDEMFKLLKGQAVAEGLKVMESSGLMQQLFPFRLRNNEWFGSWGAKEPWQLLSLFCREASEKELVDSLGKLRLSSKEQRAIEKAWKVWRDPESFFRLGLGKELQMLCDEGVLWALQVLRLEGSLWVEQIKELFTHWDSWQRQLPKPFLTGQDLKGKITGKAMGHCLSEALEMQLERKLQSRQEALVWLEEYVKREFHG